MNTQNKKEHSVYTSNKNNCLFKAQFYSWEHFDWDEDMPTYITHFRIKTMKIYTSIVANCVYTNVANHLRNASNKTNKSYRTSKLS